MFTISGGILQRKSQRLCVCCSINGSRNSKIIFSHILPNSLTPVISFAPFAIVANIFSLVSLDFLGFGLPPPTPSWGQLMQQGLSNIDNWWLIVTPLVAMFFTLLTIVFIGEAIREAFDPKIYSRLR
ncbi:MAG: ABC transporter permease subunit [Ignavibacteria bacterium]